MLIKHCHVSSTHGTGERGCSTRRLEVASTSSL